MARIQILELPTEHHGDDMVTPFVLIVDQADYDSLNSLSAALEGWQSVKDQIGARAVIVFEESVEIPANNNILAGGEVSVSGPDFVSPIAGRVEVRQPCPFCDDRQMIPRNQFAEHVSRMHSGESRSALNA